MLHNNLYTIYGKLVCYAVIYQLFNMLREHQVVVSSDYGITTGC